MPILNWDKIESDKEYNHYDFGYDSVSFTFSLIIFLYPINFDYRWIMWNVWGTFLSSF